ncbi:MAG TPA: arsenite methyltransferase [Bacteroidales bacterium]|nr:arsenite methyltransferase [Bacteroidales bacterium]
MKDIKKHVREAYSEIARDQKDKGESSCCAANSCCGSKYSIFSEDYSHLEGYNQDADLGLGCGIPTVFAGIKTGDTVLDLGSGAGNDCFIARKLTGETGEVIGIDFTPEMVELAVNNLRKSGYTNVYFRLGDIEHLPVTANKADVVISNCVLNLIPDKSKAFSEIFRVLKTGGHFSVSDIVLKGNVSNAVRSAVALYAGCISGALQYDDYLSKIFDAGFSNIRVHSAKQVIVPDALMLQHISDEELMEFRNSGTEIMSITVSADKPKTCCCGCDC